MTGPNQSRISSWDGLRGIAILLVLAGHSWEAYGQSVRGTWMEKIHPIIGNSSFGVRLFFALSGYLITQLLLNETRRFGQVSLGKFYARRTLRIFPAFYCYILTIVLLAGFGLIQVSSQQLIAAATYTWNYAGIWSSSGPAEGSWFLGHLWTLSLEEQFYLFWPLTLVCFGTKSARWISVIIPLIMPLVRIGWYFAFPDHRGFLGMMLHTAIDSILVGCAFALWRERSPIAFEKLLSKRRLLTVTIVFVFGVSPMVGELIRSYRITVGFLLDAIGAGVLILHASRPGLFSRTLSWQPLAWLGRMSYSIYLWQQLFLTPYNTTVSGRFPLCFIFIFGAAIASYYLIERPVLRWKGRFERSRIESSMAPVET